MTRLGVSVLLVGLLVAGLGGAGYLFCWSIGAALVLVGAVVAGIGKAGSWT